MYVGMNYIDGSFTKNRQDFSSYCPYTEEEIGIFPMSTPTDVMEAVEAAKVAFPKWRSLSRVVRAEYFDKLCQILKTRSQGISHLISKETGKPLNESVAEVNEALHMAQYTVGMGRMPCGEVIASEIADKDSYVLRKPKGVVGVIAPWNFPFAIGGFWCAAPALLEGNTVVFKPSEDTPMIGQIIAELYDEAGFPPGVFNLIHGDGVPGSLLVRHNDVKHICFTGSAAVGKDIRKACANSWDKSCSCELGSKSAVIVFNDADMELALAACVASAYKLSGQRCVSSGRLIVQDGVIMQFMERFVELSQKAKVGDPFEHEVFMGPLINDSQRRRVESYNQQAKDHEGVQVLLQGGRLDRKGYFLTPHVYTCAWKQRQPANFLREEVFGPHVAIVPFADLDEAIEIYNDTDYGLSLGVVTNDFKKARVCRDRCDFGLGYWNGGSIAAESHLPFGGIKKSGNGWPSAAGTFKAVTHEVTWTVNHGPLAFPQGLK